VFSDRFRILKISALLLFILASCLAAQLAFHELTLEECLAAPAAYDGRRVPVALGVTLGRIEPQRFWVSGGPAEFAVEVPGGTAGLNLRSGDFFQAVTVFRRSDTGGYLELEEIRPAPLRRLKIVVSVLPVLLVAVLLVRSIRLERGFLVLRGDSGRKGGSDA